MTAKFNSRGTLCATHRTDAGGCHRFRRECFFALFALYMLFLMPCNTYCSFSHLTTPSWLVFRYLDLSRKGSSQSSTFMLHTFRAAFRLSLNAAENTAEASLLVICKVLKWRLRTFYSSILVSVLMLLFEHSLAQPRKGITCSLETMLHLSIIVRDHTLPK